MDIRLLGRFDVLVDDRPLSLGGPRQRAVLAVLAIHANEIVSMDRLAEEVWGGEPPATAIVTLQRYVSHLRRALEGPAAAIETERPGYRLRVDPDAIDARRFEAMVDEGRRHLASGRAEEAAAVLRAALALWQGEPLADFAYEPFARIETTRLEELRSTAVELRIDADLEVGRHRDLVPELEALVAAHPLRESFRGQLMRALHGSGRRADALRVYSEGRRVLAEELGLDPSTGLQRLEQAILLKDPDVEAPEPPRRSAPVNRLPAELTTFVGRAEEVDEILRLVSRARLVTLTGAGGSGKSRLALRVASELAPSYAAGAALVELGGVTEPEVVPRAIAHALGVREDPERSMAESLVDALRTQHCLIVLDECEHLLDAVAPLVQHVLTGTERVSVLATSREDLGLPGEAVYRVPTLSVPPPADDSLVLADLLAFDGVRLFIERAAAVDAAFAPVDADAPVIAEVCRRLDGLPLALELAAARLDVLTLSQLSTRLDDRFDLLTSGPRTAPPRQRTLRATIGWSYDLLSSAERLLFERLSVFAGSFTVESVEAVCAGDELDRAEVFHLLAGLVRKSLVVRVHSTGAAARYRLLETLRDFARERLSEGDCGVALFRCHADYFTEVAEKAAPALLGPSVMRLLGELEAEHDEFRAALSWLIEQEDAEAACRLTHALSPFWDASYLVQDGWMWCDRVLALAERIGLPASSAYIWTHVHAAYFALYLDAFAASNAHLDAAMRLLKEREDDLAESTALRVRAELARYNSEHEWARQLSFQAVALAARHGDIFGEADGFRVLALASLDLGDLEEYAAAADQCLRRFQLMGSPERIAGAQFMVGRALWDQGRLTEAIELVEDAMGRFQQIAEPVGIGQALWTLSTLASLQAEYEVALHYARESVELHERLDSRRGVGRGYQVLADAEFGLGHLDAAEAASARAVAMLRDRGFTGDVLVAAPTAALVRLRRDDAPGALAVCDEALAAARERGYGRAIGRLLCLRAEIMLAMGEAKEATAQAEEARELFRRAGDMPGVAGAELMLGHVAAAEDRRDDAAAHVAAAHVAAAAKGGQLNGQQRTQAAAITRPA